MFSGSVIGRRTSRAIACVGLLFGMTPTAVSGDPEPKLTITSPAEGAFVGPRFAVRGKLTGAPAGSTVRVGDGTAAVQEDGTFEVPAIAETEGVWTIRVLYGPVGVPAIIETRDVTVDTTPPKFEGLLPDTELTRFNGEEGQVSGRVVDTSPVSLRINGRAVKLAADGTFESIFVLPKDGDVVIKLEATDAAGNVSAPIVRRLRRMGELGTAILSFEKDGVFWISRDGSRFTITDETLEIGRTIREHEWKTAPFGTIDHPSLVAIRTSGVVAWRTFVRGYAALLYMNGAHQIDAPPPNSATTAFESEVVDFASADRKAGSWRVSIGSKSWVVTAADLLAYADIDSALPPTVQRSVDELKILRRNSQRFRVVRFRFAEPVPLRLFAAFWDYEFLPAGQQDVILERLDPASSANPAAATSSAERARLEAVLAGTNEPMAVRAALELADKNSVESIPALRAALQRAGSTAVRGAAAKALGRLNDLDSIPVLIELLKNPDGSLAADADTGLASMSGLGRVVKETMSVDQRIPIAERYARWWRGAESGLRARRVGSTTGAPSSPGRAPPPPADAGTKPADAKTVRGAFRDRGRIRAASFAGNRAEEAVKRGLLWLASHQSPDGSWEAEGWRNWCDQKASPEGADLSGAGRPKVFDVGVTGLALLAFLGAGYTDRAEGPYGPVVKKGLTFLRGVQDAEGCFGPRATGHFVYNHAIAAQAMIEAFGMTFSPDWKGSAQRAFDFIAVARNPNGTWRYGVRPGDSDLSVTGWMSMALASARLSYFAEKDTGEPSPLSINFDVFDGIDHWVEAMTDPKTGRAGYQTRGTGPIRLQESVAAFPADRSESMTAVGLVVRIFCVRQDPRFSDDIQRGVDLCSALTPVWNTQNGSIDMYYWYYGTLAMYQIGGEAWTKWEDAMNSAITRTQRADGNACAYLGSWDPVDPWGPDGGRIYSTALMTLCLEVRGRYDRVFPDIPGIHARKPR